MLPAGLGAIEPIEDATGDLDRLTNGAIVGGIGLAASGNIDPSRSNPSMFEPVHGSAPDIAGKNIANPLATILSAAMMLRYSLGLPAEADRIEKAVQKVLAQGLCTADIYTEGTKKVSTVEMGDAVVAALA
mgnify:CR=1 FL=1